MALFDYSTTISITSLVTMAIMHHRLALALLLWQYHALAFSSVPLPARQAAFQSSRLTSIQETIQNNNHRAFDNDADNSLFQDSIERFEHNVTTVLKELRVSETDNAVPALFRRDNNGGPSFSKTWTLQDWERHSSRRRYLDYILTFAQSRMLRRLLPQMSVLTVWSILAVWLVSTAKSTSSSGSFLSHFTLPLTPLSLVSTFVAALLTLRSNQGLDRLQQGRAAFRNMLWYARDVSQLIAASVYPRHRYLALKCLRHLALFGWLLKNFMRGEEANGTDADILNTMLVPVDADYILKQRKKPVAVVTRLRQVLDELQQQKQLSTALHLRLEDSIHHLNECITTCERIRASPIPPLYTSHTGLLLIFYLFSLPLALQGSELMSPVGTILTTAVVGYAMLGLDEISHVLEQPFKLMPLYQISKTSMLDVSDSVVCRPPKLEDVNVDYSKMVAEPTYW